MTADDTTTPPTRGLWASQGETLRARQVIAAPMTDDITTRLDAIEAYCAAATEGPWEVADPATSRWDSMVAAVGEVIVINRAGASTGDTEAEDDATFIANARTDLPAVVAALRDALAENARLTRQVQAVEALCDRWAEDDGAEPPLLTPAGAATAVRAAIAATEGTP